MTDANQAASPLPRRRPPEPSPSGLPQRGQPSGLPQPRQSPSGLPQRGAQPPGSPVTADGGLPRRTATSWRVGRHRSMHRLSVASDAPELIIAVPGTASAADHDLIERIAEAAAESCAGATIAVGFLGRDGSGDGSGDGSPGGRRDPDNAASLAAVFASAPVQADERLPRAVIVPLLAGPHPAYDGQIAAAVAASDVPVMVAAHLGPHPLLAGALHDRLSEVGLARVSRALGLSISVGADGVLLVADRGPEAVSDAGLTAILLAGRLAAPVHPASLGDQASVDAALTRLREAGATRPAIAPCVIGPETDMAEFERLSASLGAACAAPLGSHAAISQLIAARYGEALARMAAVSH